MAHSPKEPEPTAAQRVLNLTELLDHILSFVYERPIDSQGAFQGGNNLIAAGSIGLLRVNRLWFSIAVKYVWRRCGYHPGPDRSDLGKLAMGPMRYIPPTLRGQSERLQFYADFIEDFDFMQEFRTIGRDMDAHAARMARLETLLPELELPRIRRISMTGAAIRFNEKPGVIAFALPFLRPSLRELSITVTNLPSSLWTTLKDRCPQLERLNIRQWDGEGPDTAYIADEAFRSFISSTTSLKILILEHKGLWSQAMLSAIAHNPSLVEFVCGVDNNFVNPDWIEALKTSESEPFKNLKTLALWTTSTAFNRLTPLIKNVSNLTVRLDRGLIGEHCSNFHHLSNLEHFHLVARYQRTRIEDTVKGRALLSLAQSCPRLKTLTIGNRHNDFTLDSFTDGIISTLTLCLPHLQTFRLLGTFSLMTGTSILSFAANCKALTSLEISAFTDVFQLARSCTPGMFPALRHFYLHQGYELDFTYHQIADVEDVANRLADMMPRVTELRLSTELLVEHAGNEMDILYSLDKAVRQRLGITKTT